VLKGERRVILQPLNTDNMFFAIVVVCVGFIIDNFNQMRRYQISDEIGIENSHNCEPNFLKHDHIPPKFVGTYQKCDIEKL